MTDADSRWALADARELYTLAEARASSITKQKEDLAVRARQVIQQEREVEKLEGLLQEREELDDITLRHELEALSTRETSSTDVRPTSSPGYPARARGPEGRSCADLGS
jgi:hypothetical protein